MTIENVLERIAVALETLAGAPVTGLPQKAPAPSKPEPDPTPEAEKKRRGPKPKSAEAELPGEPLPPVEEDAKPKYTKDTVRSGLQGLKDREVGLAILKKFKAKTLSELVEDDYPAVMTAIKEAKENE